MAFKLRSPLHIQGGTKKKETTKKSKPSSFKDKASNIVKRQEEKTKKVSENYKGTKSLFGNQSEESPLNLGAGLLVAAVNSKAVRDKIGKALLPSSYNKQGPGGRGIATSGDAGKGKGPLRPKETGKGSGVIPDMSVGPNASDGIMVRDAGTNTKTTKPKPVKKKNTKKQVKPTTTIDAGSNTNKDKSGGYLKDTKNFSLGVDTKLDVAPMPKFERTVTNARSADYDMIRAKGRGKIDRLKTRLDKREGRVANRVEASSMRIKSRQKRSGERYASKMEARTNTGTNPGKFESQKKLDAFEKVMDSPKATPRTSGAGNISSGSTVPSLRKPKSNQKPDGARIKLNTSKQTSTTIDDNKIKKGAKEAKGGGRVSKDTYKSLTGFEKLKKKPGSSGGFRRGVSGSSTSIKRNDLSKGPRA